MVDYLIGILALAGLCAGWGLFQLWMTRADPGYRGLQGGCGGCRDNGPCRKECGRESR